jgi:hypothetical protein
MRVARKPKPSAWAIADRQDENGSIQFHAPMAWMEDMSVWEDVQEANNYTRTDEEIEVPEAKPRRPRRNFNRHDTREQILALLKDGPKRTGELGKLTGLDAYATEFLRQMHVDQLVRKGDKRGIWLLREQPAEAAELEPDREPPAGMHLEVIEDWETKLRIIADYEQEPVGKFVDKLLRVYTRGRVPQGG